MIGEFLTFPGTINTLLRLNHLEGFRPDDPWHYDWIVAEAPLLDGG